jgi:hypothetical protein
VTFDGVSFEAKIRAISKFNTPVFIDVHVSQTGKCPQQTLTATGIISISATKETPGLTP